MAGFTTNLEQNTIENENFRKVLYTTKKSQLVLMCLQPGEEIGLETHPDHDQFIRIDQGKAQAVLNGEEHKLEDGFAVVIPAGTEHNIINTSDSKPLKLYTLYTPPEHPDGTIHKTKSEADEYEKNHHS